MKLDPDLSPCMRINYKPIKDSNLKAVKLLEGNIDSTQKAIGVERTFWVELHLPRNSQVGSHKTQEFLHS